MNSKELDILLSKYYRGETSLDEELQLRNALSDDSADALLMKELEAVDNEIEVPADLEKMLSDKIDEWEADEKNVAKVAPSQWRRTAWAAAASIAVVAAIGWWYVNNNSQPIVEKKAPVIAAVPEKVPAVEPIAEGEPVVTPPQPAPMPQVRAQKTLLRDNKKVASHLAQVKKKSGAEELSANDEEMALAALEKFSSVLSKGMEQVDDASEKIDNINKTINQYL